MKREAKKQCTCRRRRFEQQTERTCSNRERSRNIRPRKGNIPKRENRWQQTGASGWRPISNKNVSWGFVICIVCPVSSWIHNVDKVVHKHIHHWPVGKTKLRLQNFLNKNTNYCIRAAENKSVDVRRWSHVYHESKFVVILSWGTVHFDDSMWEITKNTPVKHLMRPRFLSFFKQNTSAKSIHNITSTFN